MVRPKGHIGNKERVGCSARYGARVVDHFVERELGGGAVSQADLGERVADEGYIDQGR